MLGLLKGICAFILGYGMLEQSENKDLGEKDMCWKSKRNHTYSLGPRKNPNGSR